MASRRNPCSFTLSLRRNRCPRVYRGSIFHPTHWKSNAISSRDGALMQEIGQQIRANAHTCAGCGTLYTIWQMYWWRLLLELRLPLLSTAYSVSGSPELVLRAAALLEPSFKIPGPRSRSQGQLCASGARTGLSLGPAHLGFTCRLLAPADDLLREDWSPDLNSSSCQRHNRSWESNHRPWDLTRSWVF
jgi:hypothetical protein